MAKSRMVELAGQVREAAKRHEPIANTIIDLIQLSIDEAKESLVKAEGNDIYRVQGAIQHMQKLHKELTVTPPSISTPGATT